jgi:hypothetical protein
MKHTDNFRTVSACSDTGGEILHAARMGHPVGGVFFFFQALNFLVESFGLLNDRFPLPSILDAGYPVFFFFSFGRCPV